MSSSSGSSGRHRVYWVVACLLALLVAGVLYRVTTSGNYRAPAGKTATVNALDSLPAGDQDPRPGGTTPDDAHGDEHRFYRADCATESSGAPAEPGTLISDDDFQQEINATVSLLSQSSDPEHLLGAAILTQQGDPTQLDLLQRAYDLDPANPLTLWSLFQACFKSDRHTVCQRTRPEIALQEIDGQNSRYWAAMTARHFGRDDKTLALAALRQASAASNTSGYWIERIELFERAFASVGDWTYTQRVTMAIGAAAAMTDPALKAFPVCEQQAAIDAQWWDVCLNYAQREEQQASTLLRIQIALALQRTLHRMRENAEKADELEARSNRLRDALSVASSPSSLALFQHEASLREYLQRLATDGEIAALHYLRERGSALASFRSSGTCSSQ